MNTWHNLQSRVPAKYVDFTFHSLLPTVDQTRIFTSSYFPHAIKCLTPLSTHRPNPLRANNTSTSALDLSSSMKSSYNVAPRPFWISQLRFAIRSYENNLPRPAGCRSSTPSACPSRARLLSPAPSRLQADSRGSKNSSACLQLIFDLSGCTSAGALP